MKKKTLLLSLTAVIMVAALAVGGTLAYFTDKDDATNAYTVGNVDIDLFEHKVSETIGANGESLWELTTDTLDSNTYTNVYPGAVLPKDPAVKNIGNNPAYVRVKVTIPFASVWGINNTNYTTYLTNLVGAIDASWALDATRTGLDTSGNFVFVFNHTAILAPSTTTNKLFNSFTIPTSFNNATLVSILTIDSDSNGVADKAAIYVKAEAIQSQSFTDAAAAYTALDS